MPDLTLFNENFSSEMFEETCRENGFTYWCASDLMRFLGYETWSSFSKAINKAMASCNTLTIPIIENFVQIESIIDGKKGFDYKLSRFACYLIVMNADGKKQRVAQAQAYFANLAGVVQDHLIEAERLERLNVRSEVSERESSLSGVAHKAGVTNYAFFQNAGYRGMYNKHIKQLKTIRNVPNGRSLLDFMGKDELAANLFRITQTELKIKQDNITGQGRLENTAESIGGKVRKAMLDMSGIPPEHLAKHEDIRSVKKEIKAKSKQIKSIDKKPKKKTN